MVTVKTMEEEKVVDPTVEETPVETPEVVEPKVI